MAASAATPPTGRPRAWSSPVNAAIAKSCSKASTRCCAPSPLAACSCTDLEVGCLRAGCCRGQHDRVRGHRRAAVPDRHAGPDRPIRARDVAVSAAKGGLPDTPAGRPCRRQHCREHPGQLPSPWTRPRRHPSPVRRRERPPTRTGRGLAHGQLRRYGAWGKGPRDRSGRSGVHAFGARPRELLAAEGLVGHGDPQRTRPSHPVEPP